MGLAIGAKAETDLYIPGFFRNWGKTSVVCFVNFVLVAYQGQSTVTSHAVSRNADTVAIELLEVGEKCIRKLLGNVTVHVVSFVIWLFRRVNVEAST